MHDEAPAADKGAWHNGADPSKLSQRNSISIQKLAFKVSNSFISSKNVSNFFISFELFSWLLVVN